MTKQVRAAALALFVLCTTLYLCTMPGRVVFPDDEIVYQTTASLWEHGDLSIAGIAKPTGEPSGRPPGTFGWAYGKDGKRYGFFGHGLSLVALPAYGLGKWMAAHAPESWRHAIRSDHFFFHTRSPHADWTRLMVTATNCALTALTASLVMLWLIQLSFVPGVAVATGLAYALGTAAWPYTRTFLSEPLSAVTLLLAAMSITRFHHERGRASGSWRAAAWLWIAGSICGASVHVHILNLTAVLPLAVYALVPLFREGAVMRERRAWIGAVLAGVLGVAWLGWTQYARFGSVWETGRYDHYSHFAWSLDPWLAMAASPGRSLLLYSPALVLAALGLPRFVREHRDVAWLVALLVVMRYSLVATRSDWWGGWAIGPRYLLPLLPFMMLPLASVLQRLHRRVFAARVGIFAGLTACVVLEAHLAAHSIFEWMFRLHRIGTIEGTPYIQRSHWSFDASPLLGFRSLPPDMLSVGAVRLAQHGHHGMVLVFAGIVCVGLAAFVTLFVVLAPKPRH